MGKRGIGRAAASQPNWSSLLAIGVSAAALHKIIRNREYDDDQDSDDDRLFRWHVQRNYDKIIKRVCVPMTLQFGSGATDTIPVADLEKILSWFVEIPCFERLMQQTFRRHGQACKLSTLLYFDEVTPGNPLHPDNLRKSVLVYVSFKEFGKHLRSANAWLTVAIVKHNSTEELDGKFSRFLRDLLRLWTQSPLFSAGAIIDFPNGTPTVVRLAKNIEFLPDYAAACSAWQSKTASGLRPCLKCQNVMMKGADLLNYENDDGYLVSICCADATKFDLLAEADYAVIADALKDAAAEAELSGVHAPLDREEKASGFTFHAEGLLQAQDLREHVNVCTTYNDGMHTMYGSGGSVSIEIGLFIDALRKHVSLASVQDMIRADWHAASFVKTFKGSGNAWRPAGLLSEQKLSPTHYRGSASEVLCLVPLLSWLAYSLQAEGVAPELEEHYKSFLAVCNVSREYQLLKHTSFRDSGSQLKEAISKHLVLFREAYGDDFVKPKHHLDFHVADQFDIDGVIIDCWPGERKNHDFKKLVDSGNLKKLTGLERLALGRLLNAQRSRMEQNTNMFQDHLGPSKACPELQEALGLADVQLAKWVMLGTDTAYVNDILLLSDDSAVQVVACASLDGRLGCVVKKLDFLRKAGNAHWWRPSSDVCFLKTIETRISLL